MFGQRMNHIMSAKEHPDWVIIMWPYAQEHVGHIYYGVGRKEQYVGKLIDSMKK